MATIVDPFDDPSVLGGASTTVSSGFKEQRPKGVLDPFDYPDVLNPGGQADAERARAWDRLDAMTDPGTPPKEAIGPPDKPGIADYANIGGSAFTRGAASLAGAPVDLVNFGMKLFGLGSDQPIGGSASLMAALDRIGMTDHKPTDTLGHILARVGEELGANAIPMLGQAALGLRAGSKAIGAVPRMVEPIMPPAPGAPVVERTLATRAADAGRSAVDAAKATPDALYRGLVEPARVAPGATAATGAGLAATAGLGGEAAQEVVGRDSNAAPYADMVGSLAGGLLPLGLAGAASTARRLVRPSQATIETRAAQKLGVKPTSEIPLNEGETAKPGITGERYSVAELTNDPALLAKQKASDVLPENVARANEARTQNLRAQERFAETAAPQGDADMVAPAVRAETERRVAPLRQNVEATAERAQAADLAARDEAQAVAEMARTEAADKLAAEQARATAAIDAQRGAVDEAATAMRPRPAGDASEAFRAGLQQRDAETRATATRLYDEALPPGQPVPVPAQQFKDELAALTDTLTHSSAKNRPDYLSSGWEAKIGETIDARDLQTIRSEALSNARAASAAQNKVLAERELEVAHAAERAMDWLGTEAPTTGQRVGPPLPGEAPAPRAARAAADVPEVTVTPDIAPAPELSEAWRTANAYFRGERVPLRQGELGKILGSDRTGGDKVPASAALGRVLKGGTGAREAAQQFEFAAGGRREMVDAAMDWIADTLLRTAAPDGRINRRILSNLIDKHSEALDALARQGAPEVRQNLRNVAEMQRRVDALERLAPQRKRAVATEGRQAQQWAQSSGREDIAATAARGKEQVTGAKKALAAEEAEAKKSAASYWLDHSVDKAVGKVLGAKDPVSAAREVRLTVGKDPEAIQGVARAAWDHVVGHIFPARVDGPIKVETAAKLLDPASDRGKALRIMMGPEAFDDARKLLQSAQIKQRVNNASVGSGSDTAQKALGAMDAAGTSMIGSVLSPLGKVGAVVAKALTGAREGAVRELVSQAIWDPAVYRTLVARVTQNNAEALADRLASHLTQLGLREATEPTRRAPGYKDGGAVEAEEPVEAAIRHFDPAPMMDAIHGRFGMIENAIARLAHAQSQPMNEPLQLAITVDHKGTGAPAGKRISIQRDKRGKITGAEVLEDAAAVA